MLSPRLHLRAMADSLFVVLGLALSLVLAAGATAAELDDDPNVEIADGIAVYLGVMPAAIVRGHAESHPEATMHGGPPRTSYMRHVVVALFDAKTFERITEAEVTATVEGLGHVASTTKKLERMDIANAPTFGEYFPFQGRDRFTIRIEVKIAKRLKTVVVEFTYET